MWYSLNGKEPKYEYSFNYQNWYPSAKHETLNARKNVGLFDFSTFSKFDLKGEKTHQELQKLCTANIKNEISNLIGNTKWALTAPMFFLYLADIRRNIKITNDRGYEHKNNNVDTFMNGVIDAALSMQSTICASESLGLGVCPISMIRNIIEDVKVICKLPKGVFPIAGLAMGWPDQKSNVSIRLSQDIVIHFDKYDEKDLIQKINKYDERVFKKDPIPENKQRHVNLYGVAKKGTWSENISRQLSVPERSNFKKWLNENGFNLE